MWLALEPDLMVVGEAATGTDVGELINAVSPDVVLMDVEMPGLDGVDATAVVHALRPALPVVILSLHDDIETRVRAWIAGAAAFRGQARGRAGAGAHHPGRGALAPGAGRLREHRPGFGTGFGHNAEARTPECGPQLRAVDARLSVRVIPRSALVDVHGDVHPGHQL